MLSPGRRGVLRSRSDAMESLLGSTAVQGMSLTLLKLRDNLGRNRSQKHSSEFSQRCQLQRRLANGHLPKADQNVRSYEHGRKSAQCIGFFVYKQQH